MSAPPRGRRGWPRPAALQYLAISVGLIVAAAALWEGYKLLGAATGGKIPFTDLPLPIASSDLAMPHLWTIIGALGAPASSATSESLLSYLLGETSVTLREAAYGLLLGSGLGVLLAIGLRELPMVSRGVMPWLVVSQTIPLVALAPIIVIWVGGLGLPSWVAVTIISAYLSFFPVTVNTLRGLNSADPIHLELMRSLNASRLQTLTTVRIPSAIPSLFSGLRLAAIASVIGAIVGELSAGTGLGIGRAILSAAYFYSTGPEKLFAAVLVASLAGVVFVQIIAIAESLVLRRRTQ
ncbi:ABC transporter permease [Agrococcus sp. HG114]|uniref:ABC transporter permease n=1 Tax=Agrococcus sp. HG114 TaxID=2969757 RepID=UPI00215A7033|nr:ABC transporter permease subunit [Agrococcus sp. HG114]MCR8669784.1 ABC transporter permease subunit [Agrococcus sp. HG114]